jgi:hypothetical protein
MSSTPLADSIIMLHNIMDDFAKKVEKPIFVNMIDGDTHSPYIRTETDKENRANKVIFMNNKKFDMQCDMYTRDVSIRRAVVDKFVKSLGYQTVCIFMAPSPNFHSMRHIVSELCVRDNKGSYQDVLTFNRKALKTDGCAVYDDCFGYDCFYITCPTQLDSLEDGKIQGDSIAKVRKSFMSNNSNKKKKNYMITHFGKYIA